jgi:hypothetical protein
MEREPAPQAGEGVDPATGLQAGLRDFFSSVREGGLEQRLLRMTCLLGGGLCFFAFIPLNLWAGLSRWVDLALALFGLGCAILYILSRRGIHLHATLCVLVLLLLGSSWFVGGGSNGSIGFFFFSGPLITVVLLRGWRRGSVLGLYLLAGLALVWLDHRYPQLVIPFDSRQSRLLDFLTTVPGSILACALVMHLVISAFDEERRRLEQLMVQHQASLTEIHTLRGLLPICSSCKKIRDDRGLWTQVEEYVSDHSEAHFTHGLCPDCATSLVAEFEALPSQRPPPA